MSDWRTALERLMTSSLGTEIHDTQAWALTITNSDKLEVFLNPEDAEGLEGCRLWGMPVRKSIGVQQGKALIFDHRSGKYIRKGEQLDWKS
ncbi:hypothetical protein D0Z67_29530 (plasmid) [Streptomyces seoulensis]|uniref:Uncharacterized protein n=1 Tax=Streptomyces seoulensis TaxID=73044 RepID=A0A4P6U5K4_STRSO|nr:hypothetical protein [Streptomyces seoulensis]QBJ94511.1 hypothetical protein D0Z67_29530 [Streptomyces seoulensis]